MREVVQLVTGSPGGIGGFFDKLRSAGFGSQVASWLGKTDGTVLTAPQVQTALGGSVLNGIAHRVGIADSVAGTAIGVGKHQSFPLVHPVYQIGSAPVRWEVR